MANFNEGYGICPKCGEIMQAPAITNWDKPIVKEYWYCEDCDLDVLVTSERVKGCHYCKSEDSVRYNKSEQYHYCRNCNTITDPPEVEHWHRWVKTEPAEIED